LHAENEMSFRTTRKCVLLNANLTYISVDKSAVDSV